MRKGKEGWKRREEKRRETETETDTKFFAVVVRTVPLMVPEPRRSPGRALQPEMVWWASCCFIVQYMYLKLVLETTLPFPPSAERVAQGGKMFCVCGCVCVCVSVCVCL